MNDHRSEKWSAANIYGKWSGIPDFLFFFVCFFCIRWSQEEGLMV